MGSGRNKRVGLHSQTQPITPGAQEELALVQWMSGPDSGQYTPNCPLNWILDFDMESWDRSTLYGVEWRKPPKPSRGWTILDAVVLEVSRNSSFLEKCMERLQHDSESEKENSCPPTPSRVGSGLDEPAMMKLIQSAVTQAIAANCRTASPAGSSTVSTSSTEMVDIGHNVLIPNHIHTMALATASPTRMTSMLLQGAYTSDKHLIGKSYAGQKKTIAGKVYQKPGVKKRRKIIAIQNLVFKKYPTFSRSSFGQTINNYISKLSIPSKRQLSEEDLEDDTDDELLS